MNDEAIINAIVKSIRTGSTKITDSHLNRYDKLRGQLKQVVVSNDYSFQSMFSGLFQLRWMPRRHRSIYFGMMQQQKEIDRGHSFRDLLQAYYDQTGRWEVSFITKLIAIIDPSRSVWDSLVSRRLCLSLPVVRNLETCAARYEELSERMTGLLAHRQFQCVVDAFENRFPKRCYKQMRILDATIWGLG
jgi:hypothetical protein